MTTLYEAIDTEDIACLKDLIDHAVANNDQDILDKPNSDGITPLQYAAKQGKLKALDLLISSGVAVKLRSKNNLLNINLTALHYAVRANQVEAAKKLLEAGADPNAADSRGYRPLHYASEQGNQELITLLIDNKADPNCRSLTRMTPAHLIAQSGSVSCAKKLKEWRMDITAKNSAGMLPIHIAYLSGRMEVVKEFLQQSSSQPDVPFEIDTKTLYTIFGGEKLSKFLPDGEIQEGGDPKKSLKVLTYYLVQYFILNNFHDQIANKILTQLKVNDDVPVIPLDSLVEKVMNYDSVLIDTGHIEHLIPARLEKNSGGQVSLFLYDKGQYSGPADPKNKQKVLCIRVINFNDDATLINGVIGLLRKAYLSEEKESEDILFNQIPKLLGSEYKFLEDFTQKPIKIGKCHIGNYSLLLCDIFIKELTSIKKGMAAYKDFSIYLREAVLKDFQSQHHENIDDKLKDALSLLARDVINEKKNQFSSLYKKYS